MSNHKLSPAQRKALELLAKGGTLIYWPGGVISGGNAFVHLPNGMSTDISVATAFRLSRTPYLTVKDKDWRRTIFVISEAGRAALEPKP